MEVRLNGVAAIWALSPPPIEHVSMAHNSQTLTDSTTIALENRRTINVSRWVKIGVTIGVLLLLGWQVRWKDLFGVVLDIKGLGAITAVALWIPNQWLQYMRWNLIARSASHIPTTTDIREGYWLGHTLGFITPGRIGVYGRGLFLKTVPIGEATALTVLERSYSAITVNGFGLIALALLPGLGWHAAWANWSTNVSAIMLVIGIVVLSAGVFPGQIARAIATFTANRSYAKGISNALGTVSKVPIGSSILYLCLATASLLVSLTQFLLLLSALGITIPIVAGLLAIHLNFFLKGNIPLTIGNLGVGEWTALLCLRGLGVPDTQAVAASLLLYSMNVAVPALIGVRFIRRVFNIHHEWSSRAK